MPRAWRFLPCGKKQEGSMRGIFIGAPPMNHSFFQSFDLFLRTQGRGVILLLACCQIPSGSWGAAVASERFLRVVDFVFQSLSDRGIRLLV